MGSGRTPFRANPSLLYWARTDAGMSIDDVATKFFSGTDQEKLGQWADRVLSWEQGSDYPSLAQARKLADIYHRPLATFLLEAPPSQTPLPNDFRQFDADTPPNFSTKLRLEIRKVRNRQLWLRDWLIENRVSPLPFVSSWKSLVNPESLANQIRQTLGISFERQSSFPDPDSALRHWIDLVEIAGINVVQGWAFESSEARGFALVDDTAPFIYINTRDSQSGRVFTLFHELVHIWIGESAVSNAAGPGEFKGRAARVEPFCNRVAAMILVPNDVFDSLRESFQSDNIDYVIAALSKRFSVSREVIARRMLERTEISQEQYDTLRIRYRREYQAMRDSADGFLQPGLRFVMNNGARFSGAVLEALAEGQVSVTDASDLLGATATQFDRLENEVGSTFERRARIS